MTHLTESEFARAADGSLEGPQLARVQSHIAACTDCAATLDAQAIARRVLVARPIDRARDLSAAVRAALENERPWIERLNWRRLSLRVAPVAAALTLVALFLVRTADNSATATTATSPEVAATNQTVASALWSGDVTDDELLSLFLRAQPDEALSTYVPNKNREK